MPDTCLSDLESIRCSLHPCIAALGLRSVQASTYFHDGRYWVTIRSGDRENRFCSSSPDAVIGRAVRALRAEAVHQGIDLAAWLAFRRLERETADALDLLVAGCE